VHLHGFQQRTKKGGHIISGSVEKADVYIYPINEFELYQNDLTLTVERDNEKIRVGLRNSGMIEVRQVAIQVEVSDTSVNFRKTIPLMRPGQRVDVEFEETEATKFHAIQVQVDPENRIWEIREDNNMVKFPAAVKELSGF
jgi:subtilase family serine protease